MSELELGVPLNTEGERLVELMGPVIDDLDVAIRRTPLLASYIHKTLDDTLISELQGLGVNEEEIATLRRFQDLDRQLQDERDRVVSAN